jgi:hypothetical protein
MAARDGHVERLIENVAAGERVALVVDPRLDRGYRRLFIRKIAEPCCGLRIGREAVLARYNRPQDPIANISG